MNARSFFTCCVLLLPGYAAAIPFVGIAEVRQSESGVSVRQLTSADWEAGAISSACLIGQEQQHSLNNPAMGTLIGCMDLPTREWALSEGEDPALGYAIVQEGLSCSNTSWRPSFKDYVLPAANVRYLDIEKLRYQFSSDVLLELIAPSSGDSFSDAVVDKEVTFFRRGGGTKFELHVREFDSPNGNMKIHYSQLWVEKWLDSKPVSIPVADFWVRAFPLHEPEVLQSRYFFSNWLAVSSESPSAPRIEPNLHGPFYRQSYFYLIQESFGYEATYLDLFRYDNTPKSHPQLVEHWEQGC